jgi:methionyl-tRNA formyltransferase
MVERIVASEHQERCEKGHICGQIKATNQRMSSPLKIILITQEEPFYIPKMIRHILENQGGVYEVVGVTRLQPHRKNKTIKDWALERTRIYTYWELFITVCLFVHCKITWKLWSKISGYTPYSMANLYKRHNVHQLETDDLNDRNFVARLTALNPDVIVSISPPQLFQEALLAVPTKHCLNVHGTLLPRHRGVFGSWWTIFEQDKEAGGTIHTMELKLDAGEIVWQESFPTTKKDTQYSIAYKTKQVMAKGVIDTLTQIQNDALTAIPVTYTSSYHRAPTAELGKDFHRKGYRVICLRDVKNVLRHRYPYLPEEKAND